jgi:hypothetical protein
VTVSTIAKPQIGPILSEPKSIDHGNPLTPVTGGASAAVGRCPEILTHKEFVWQ